MIAKVSVDYNAFPEHSTRVFTHRTDDPIELEDFLMHLLTSRTRILQIRHEGVELTPHQSDRLIKVAAERIASTLVREALHLDAAAVKDRFGFAA